MDLRDEQVSAFRPLIETPHRLHAQSAPNGTACAPPSPPRASPFRPLLAATINLIATYSRTNTAFRVPSSLPRRCLTKPGQAVHNGGFDNANNDLVIHVGDHFMSDRGAQYVVLDMLGTGTFGQVVKCRDPLSSREVAVKVIKRHAAFKNQAWIEISILRILHQNQSAEHSKHIVRFITHFIYRGHLCLVFELLSINLYQFLKQRSFRGVALPMLRNLLTQLLRALNVLVRCGIIHCDLKPENILLNDFQTTDIKVIDFGSACQLEHPVYSYVQSRFYRSPEVLLGLPKYDSQIDMWSLGCVAGELFLGVPLFPGQNEMNMVARIDEMLGPMSDMFLCRCRQTSKFFNVTRTFDGMSDARSHELKPVEQYEAENNVRLAEWKRYLPHKTLRDTIMKASWKSDPPHTEEIALRRSFVDLLAGMLKVDPLERLSPAEAMAHPFIQLGPLPNGQPWVPPGRPRRIPRLRPASIDIPLDGRSDNGAYANSAPTLRGHPRMAHAIPSASDHVYAAFSGDPGFGIQSGAAHSVHYSPYAGSYIPPPAFPHFGYGTGPAVYRQSSAYPFPLPGQDGTAMRTQGRRMNNGGQSLGASSAMAVGPMLMTGVKESNSPRITVQPAPPSMSLTIPYGSAPRRSGQLHGSSSRESLNASLRMSHSRESLNAQRVSSSGDLQDEHMFPFGDEDDSFNATRAQQQPFVAPGSAPSIQAPLPPVHVSTGRQPPSYLPGGGYAYYAQQTRIPPPMVGVSSPYTRPQVAPMQLPGVTEMEMGVPIADPALSSPGNSGSGGNAYTRRPPQPHASLEGVQSPRSQNASSSSSSRGAKSSR